MSNGPIFRAPLVAMAVAIAATGCTTTTDESSAVPIPPPPPVTEMDSALPAYPEDGLHRFVVEPLDDDTGGNLGPAGAGGGPGSRWIVPNERIDSVPDDATLVFEGGIPGYFEPSGAFVPINGGRAAPIVGSYGHPTIDALAALNEVVAVTAIGDGTYAMTTTDPDVLADWRVAVTEDPPFGLATDPYQPYQWSLDNTGTNLDSLVLPTRPVQIADADIDGTEAAAAPPGGHVVVVAVVDSGVDFSHPDLSGSAWVNEEEICDNGIDDDANGFVDDCNGWDFASDDNEPYTSGHVAHGTHVAGIIAASADNNIGIAGAAPDVRIMDLSVSATGTITASSIARAVRYAVDNGADVINLSLGSAPGVPLSSVSSIVEAVIHAESNGVLVVAAAGNHGVDITTTPVYPASIETTNLLVVGASTPGETKASFSNHGATVDLFAPGELILSTVPGGEYSFMSGTSQAAPLAAAIAARVLEQNPDATPSAVIQQIVGSSDESDGYRDFASSPVRLNAARALGIDPDDPTAVADGPAPMVSVFGLASATPEAVEARIELNPPGGQFNQPFHWEATLVTMVDENVYAVIEHPIAVGGDEQTTNDRGSVHLAEKTARGTDLVTALPPGKYGLIIEAVPDVDPDARLTDAYVSVFVLGEGDGDSTGPEIEVSPTPVDEGDPGFPTPADPDGGTPGDSPATDPSGSTTTTKPSNGSTGGGSSDSGGSDSSGSSSTVPSRPSETTSDPSSDRTDESTTSTTKPKAKRTTTTAPDGRRPADKPTTTTTAPGGGTAPPVDGPSGSVPDSVGPADVTDGEWSIESITPRSGPVSFENIVSISGDFPRTVHVWFGGEPGEVYYQTSTWLLVRTPRSATAGAVDVDLRTNHDGVVLTVPDGFTYLGDGDSPPTIDSGGDLPGAPDSGSTDGDDRTDPPDVIIVPDPGEDTTIDLPVPNPTEDDEDKKKKDKDKDPKPPKTRNRQARAVPTGEPVELGNGLVGRSLNGLSAIDEIAACTSDPCETQTISGPRNIKSAKP